MGMVIFWHGNDRFPVKCSWPSLVHCVSGDGWGSGAGPVQGVPGSVIGKALNRTHIWRGKRINLHFYLQKFWLLNRKKHVQYTLCTHACLCVCVVCVLSGFSHVWLFVNPWTIALQAPLSMGFSRQENWSGFLCPPPGDLPDPGIESTPLMSPAMAGRFFTTRITWEAKYKLYLCYLISHFFTNAPK